MGSFGTQDEGHQKQTIKEKRNENS